MPTFDGVLTVTACEARGLPNMDGGLAGGNQEPFLIMYLENNYKKLTRAPSGTDSVRWNETFDFPVGPTQRELYIECQEKDFNKDDFIGATVIQLQSIFRDSTDSLDRWYPIHDRQGQPTGEVRLILKYNNNSGVASQLEEKHQQDTTHNANKKMAGMVTVGAGLLLGAGFLGKKYLDSRNQEEEERINN
ncbi:hypothetical protein K7432_008105 [Basidiobolus ranarum]|uniref:C2 domain-containing protein n=1 Tax=Basidiobolus ranarum TaxID=34480 RepID=A0ABR2WSA6_9FUNG